jgi:hypothetical protein
MNPIIMLWAHPRSMSTAIERVMRERGDLNCLHEPFLHYYYLGRKQKTLPHFDSELNHPTSYADTRDLILENAEDSAVFCKDMSYYVVPEILEDVDFCKRVRHSFLIRNPKRSIMSYYKLDAEVQQYEIGIESQWQLLQGLEALGINNSIVFEAESVRNNTTEAMRLFWESLNLEFKEEALNWNQGSTPKDWQYVKGWHQTASDSMEICKTSAADEKKADAEFDLLCLKAPQLRKYFDHHLPFYQRLKSRSIQLR